MTEEKRSVHRGILEILDRSGKTLQRLALSQDSVTIGRALDCDIVIDDPYVCPEHLRLELEETGAVIHDLDSVNGSYQGRKRIDSLQLKNGQLVQFGHSQLRFHDQDSPLPATWRDSSRQGVLAWFDRLPFVLVLLALALLLRMTGSWIESMENRSLGELLTDQLFIVSGMMLWAGVWSMINRIVLHQARYRVHLGIAAMAVAALTLCTYLAQTAGFALALDSWVWPMQIAAQIVVLTAVILAHLRYATHGGGRTHAVTALLISSVLLLSPALSDYLEGQRFNSMPRLQPLLRPGYMQIRDGVSVDEFLQQSDELREQLEQAER